MMIMMTTHPPVPLCHNLLLHTVVDQMNMMTGLKAPDCSHIKSSDLS